MIVMFPYRLIIVILMSFMIIMMFSMRFIILVMFLIRFIIVVMFLISFMIIVILSMRFILMMLSMTAVENLFALRNDPKVFSGLEKVAQSVQLLASAVPVLLLAGTVEHPAAGREHPLQVPTVEDLAPSDQVIIVRITAGGSGQDLRCSIRWLSTVFSWIWIPISQCCYSYALFTIRHFRNNVPVRSVFPNIRLIWIVPLNWEVFRSLSGAFCESCYKYFLRRQDPR